MTEWERLRDILVRLSYREGTFTLTSGKTSDFYVDCKQTTLSAEGAYLSGKLLFRRVVEAGLDVAGVGGMTLGADPLVTAVAVVSYLEGRPIPAFIVRKEPKGHGTGAWLEGIANIPQGSGVALVEDVVTTGGTLVRAVRRTEAAGLRVVQTLAIVDREEGGREALEQSGHTLAALYTRSDIVSARREAGRK